MKFEFTPPASAPTEKVRLALSPEVVAWADGLAKSAGSTREVVLEQAVAYAMASVTRPARKRSEKKGG